MKRKDFSYRWRILAHYRDPKGQEVEPKTLDISSRAMEEHVTGRTYAWVRHSEFDELVLGDWLHLEQMDEDAYWLRLGGYNFWIRRTKDGVLISHEGKPLMDYGLIRDGDTG